MARSASSVRLRSAAGGAGSRNTSVPGSATPIGRGRAPARTDRSQISAGHRFQRRVCAPPTAGSRRPARPGRTARRCRPPPRHPHRFETGEADIRLIAGTRPVRSRSHANAVDVSKSRRSRSKAHLARPGVAGAWRGPARRFERRRVVMSTRIGGVFAQPCLGAPDFRPRRQEGEIDPYRCAARAKSRRRPARRSLDVSRRDNGLHRKRRPSLHDGGIAERLRSARRRCRRHHSMRSPRAALLGIAVKRGRDPSSERRGIRRTVRGDPGRVRGVRG